MKRLPEQSQIVGLFQDENGKASPARITSFTALIAAIIVGALTFSMESKDAGITITCSLLAAAFGSKAVQKFSKKGGN